MKRGGVETPVCQTNHREKFKVSKGGRLARAFVARWKSVGAACKTAIELRNTFAMPFMPIKSAGESEYGLKTLILVKFGLIFGLLKLNGRQMVLDRYYIFRS